jgi:hypothetical protein
MPVTFDPAIPPVFLPGIKHGICHRSPPTISLCEAVLQAIHARARRGAHAGYCQLALGSAWILSKHCKTAETLKQQDAEIYFWDESGFRGPRSTGKMPQTDDAHEGRGLPRD